MIRSTALAFSGRLSSTRVGLLGRRWSSTGPTMAVDLGTSTTFVGVWEAGKPRILENAEGSRTTPSIVAKVPNKDQWLVGLPAKRQKVTNPKNTFTAVKRFIGKKYTDEGVQEDKRRNQYSVVNKAGDAWVQTTDGSTYPPQQISAMVLEKAKATAEDYFGEEVKNAVITVPAYFNEMQRTATKEAGEIAGLNVLRIINEPTAAALAYGINQLGDEEKFMIVFDLGGGTFDVSVLSMGGGENRSVQVLSTNGDTHLGGEDFDHALIEYLTNKFEEEHGVDIRDNPVAMQRISEEAEKAKIELSSTKTVEINLPFLAAGANRQALNFQTEITRAIFENLVENLIQKTLRPCKLALQDAGVDVEDIDEVLLVGGMTRMPRVQEVVKEFFRREPNRSINPDEAVALGASVQTGVLTQQHSGIVLSDVCPISIGVELVGGIFSKLVERNTTIPVRVTKTFTTADDSQTSVDINVYQGERQFCRDNKRLGAFRLTDLPAAPAGVPQIDVTFEMDANSIMHISAKDQGTGNDSSLTLKKEGVSKEEIARIQKDAERHRKADVQRRKEIEVRNEIDRMVFNSEKQIKGYTVVSKESIASLKKALEQLKKLRAENTPPEDLEKKMEETKDLLLDCGKQQYQNQGKAHNPTEDAHEEDEKKNRKKGKNKGSDEA